MDQLPKAPGSKIGLPEVWDLEGKVEEANGWLSNYGPFLGTLNIRCRIIIGIQKGTIILATTQMGFGNGKNGHDCMS